MTHHMQPESVFAVLMIAFAMDWSSLGPDGWRDKIAFLLYLAGIREGFNGGALDAWCVERLSQVVDVAKHGGNTYLAGAVSSKVVGGLVGVLILYATFCILPPWKAVTKRLGPAANLSFPKGRQYRINWPLITIAVAIGLMADLCGGVVGSATNAGLDWLCTAAGAAPDWLFG